MKITKVKLINWHAFENNTLTFKGNLIITGQNASGKSTIMDAIYYVLSGGDTRNFNSAANNGSNHNSKRTLETYILHKIGDEKIGCLRSRPIISHICIEFEQDDGQCFILGAIIELNESNTIEKFYTKDNIHIDDSLFISSSNTILSFNELKNKIDAADITKTSRKSRQTLICQDILKLNEGSRYVELLQRAIAFKPIEEVSDFVDSFLLDDNSIDIEPLKIELRSYYEIYNKVKRVEEKINFLDSFMNQANNYKNCTSDMKFLQPLFYEASIDSNNVRIKDLKKENNDLHVQKSQLSTLLDKNNEKLTKLNNEKNNAENQDIYKILKSKKEQLNSLQNQKNQLDEAITKNNRVLAEEDNILKSFNLNYSFCKDINENNFSLFCQHRSNYHEFIKDNDKELITRIASHENEMKKLNDEILNINNNISELKKHHNIYPENVSNLAKLLMEHLKNKYNKDDITVRPLCEFLEFKKDIISRWSKAIEAYLVPYRFGLIVDYKYYDDCIEFYKNNSDKENINGVKIYNTNTPLNFTLDIKENSIFDKLEFNDDKTKYLCYRLLNDVTCLDSIQDLKHHNGSGILDNCIIYKDYSFYIPDSKDYQFPYIGEESFDIRIQCLESELEQKNNQYVSLKDELNKLKELQNTLKNSKVEEIIRFTDVWTQVKDINREIDQTNKDISLYEKDANLTSIIETIKKIDEDISKIKDDNKKIENKKDFILKTIGNNGAIIETFTKENVGYTNEFNNHFYKVKSCQSQYDSFKEQFYNDKKHLKIDMIKEAKNSCENTISSLSKQLQYKVNDYVQNYNNSLSVDLNDIDKIINEYEKLKGTDIIKFKTQAENAQKHSETMFRANFINKLSGNIKAAKENIDAINKNLAKHPFGPNKEIYRFVYQPSKDEEMRQYYTIITSGKLMETQDLFSELLSEKENNIMNELFKKIATSGDDATSERNLVNLLDYRKYMTYDISITNEKGEKMFFSKTHREKSGGETQTPFYVIIASCFDQLMDKKKGYSSCPVIFDEAFNNMDEMRIDALMRYYRELDIQLIIVVPSNRIDSLAPFVDTIAALMTSDHHVDIVYLNNESYE